MNKIIDLFEKNLNELFEKDEEAKNRNELVGRFIREAYADGYAYYSIIKENKNTVRIRVVQNIGDDWTLPMWGKEATVDKNYAIRNIGMRDAFSKLLKNRGN